MGPGTPYFETAPEALRRALAVIDFGSDRAGRAAALERRARRGPPSRRALAVAPASRDSTARSAAASTTASPRSCRLPSEVTREGVLRGDRAMRDAWWDELGLGSADFWRDWTARWSDPKAGASLPAPPAR